jgi:hypothetical protein
VKEGVEKKMTLAVKSSDVRSKWAEFVDEVIHRVPKFVQRNERDIFLSINLEFSSQLVEHLRYTILLEHDDEANEYIASIDGVWIVESGETEEAALRAYLESFIEWSEDYFNEFSLNYNTPNLKPQFPYVLKALILDNVEKLLEYTDVKYS